MPIKLLRPILARIMPDEAKRAGERVASIALQEYRARENGAKYYEAYDGGGSSCGYFGLWCWQEAGFPLTHGHNRIEILQSAYLAATIHTMWQALLVGGRCVALGWHDEQYGDPRPGDLVLLRRKADDEQPGHVGLVIETHPGGARVETVEGGYETAAGPNNIGRDYWTEGSDKVVCFIRPLRKGQGI